MGASYSDLVKSVDEKNTNKIINIINSEDPAYLPSELKKHTFEVKSRLALLVIKLALNQPSYTDYELVYLFTLIRLHDHYIYSHIYEHIFRQVLRHPERDEVFWMISKYKEKMINAIFVAENSNRVDVFEKLYDSLPTDEQIQVVNKTSIALAIHDEHLEMAKHMLKLASQYGLSELNRIDLQSQLEFTAKPQLFQYLDDVPLLRSLCYHLQPANEFPRLIPAFQEYNEQILKASEETIQWTSLTSDVVRFVIRPYL